VIDLGETKNKDKDVTTEQRKTSVIGQTLKVLYAPHKAFKEIIGNPKYLAAILIMILFSAAYAGFLYTKFSRVNIEQTIPAFSQKDEWTENSTGWISSATIAESNDVVNGSYYGNSSLEFSVQNDVEAWMQRNLSEPVNCEGSEGYKNVSFRMKQLYSNAVSLSNASLYLFSSPSDYFYYNLTNRLISVNNATWYNFTLGTGEGSEPTASSLNASWNHITGLRFELMWSQNTNVSILLDGLVFRGFYKAYLQPISDYIPAFLSMAIARFVITWVSLGGLLYVMIRGLGAKPVWKIMLIVAGFCLIPMFLHALVEIVAYSTVSNLYFPVEYFNGIEAESQIASQNISDKVWVVSLIDQYAQLAMLMWTVGLCAIATRESTEFSWLKSLMIAVSASVASIFIAGLIGALLGI
jgi:hypothetical protein